MGSISYQAQAAEMFCPRGGFEKWRFGSKKGIPLQKIAADLGMTDGMDGIEGDFRKIILAHQGERARNTCYRAVKSVRDQWGIEVKFVTVKVPLPLPEEGKVSVITMIPVDYRVLPFLGEAVLRNLGDDLRMVNPRIERLLKAHGISRKLLHGADENVKKRLADELSLKLPGIAESILAVQKEVEKVPKELTPYNRLIQERQAAHAARKRKGGRSTTKGIGPQKIRRALEMAGGNMAGAASVLGVSRRALYDKRKKCSMLTE